MNKFDNKELVAKSYAFRMLVHLIGDIVQPLHSMNRFNEEYPKGDSGGNRFKLKYRYGVKSLHSLWDKVLYQERKNIRRPISEKNWDKLSNKVDQIMANYTAAVQDPTVYQNTDFDQWVQEGYEKAKPLYEGI